MITGGGLAFAHRSARGGPYEELAGIDVFCSNAGYTDPVPGDLDQSVDLLIGHPRVMDVAVIGVPNEEQGEGSRLSSSRSTGQTSDPTPAAGERQALHAGVARPVLAGARPTPRG